MSNSLASRRIAPVPSPVFLPSSTHRAGNPRYRQSRCPGPRPEPRRRGIDRVPGSRISSTPLLACLTRFVAASVTTMPTSAASVSPRPRSRASAIAARRASPTRLLSATSNTEPERKSLPLGNGNTRSLSHCGSDVEITDQTLRPAEPQAEARSGRVTVAQPPVQCPVFRAPGPRT